MNNNRSLRDNCEIWIRFDQLLRRVCKTNQRSIISPAQQPEYEESGAPQQNDHSNDLIAEEVRSFKAVHEIYTVSDEAYVRYVVVLLCYSRFIFA